DRLEALFQDLALAEGLHRRHRIRVARRPPFLLRLGIARHADLARDAVVVGRDVFISDRPVEPAIVLALHPVVGLEEARVIGKVMQRRATHTPAGLAGIAEWILAFEPERRAGGTNPPAPHFRADQL